VNGLKVEERALALVELLVMWGFNVEFVAAAACPLRTWEDEVDVLYVSLPPMCATAEWLALISLASEQFQGAEEAWAARAAAADRAAMERELGRAVQIQRMLIPDERALERCRAAGLCAAVAYQPCQEVGGDYVDVMPTVDGRTLVLVADVSGHGLGAALVSSTVHALVHAWAREGADVAELANALNRHLRETLPGDTFVTFMAALIDPRDGGMRFVNAGHPPALVAGAQGVRRVDFGDNLPLGLDDVPLEAGEERLEAGECLLLYTDGLTEQRDDAGGMLGITGLTELLWQMWGGTAGEPAGMTRGLEEALGRRQGGARADDQTFVVARRG
jgi:serine phosphatase RsbU (regulator of sigma subunit)